MPDERKPGWIKHQDLVAFVLTDPRTMAVRICTGHICSSPGSHGAGFEVDNVAKTIVWSDQTLNDFADDADDAHEKSFEVGDPRLIRRDEAHVLADAKLAEKWFKGVCSPEAIVEIARLCSLKDFGISEYERAIAARWQAGIEKLDANLEHWRLYGCPKPE